jgi:hypothetical protein
MRAVSYTLPPSAKTSGDEQRSDVPIVVELNVDSAVVLRDALLTLPIPAAPPRLSLDGAAVGLGILDAALRLSHIRRVTERLDISEHRIAKRTTELDISINLLTDNQLAAAQSIQALTSHRTTQAASTTDAPEQVLWVPVARLSHANVGQVDVNDSSGHRLPRLTQYETTRLIASGLYRLLRGILASHRDALIAETQLGEFLYRVHEPRWLIQSAILAVLTEVSKPGIDKAHEEKGFHFGAADVADPYRKMALHLFDTYKSPLSEFFQLLDVAINDQIVVVALDPQRDEHLLSYELPLYVNDPGKWHQRLWHLIRASREGYYVSYITDIPTTLPSYHLVAEATPGVDISQIILTTNAHEQEVRALERDLNDMTQYLGREGSGQSASDRGRVVDLEIQVLIRELAELMRRCKWQAATAGVSVPRRCVSTSLALVEHVEQYEAGSRVNENDQLTPLHERVSESDLLTAAKELEANALRYDLAVEKQPTSNRAHVYWRRPPPGPLASGRTQIRAGMVLRNRAETSTRTVLVYALAVAGIAYLLACFITKSIWPFTLSYNHKYTHIPSPEAMIVILLLVPGFLYTRLELPEHNSVASHLRTVPRLVAYLCIVSTAALAASVAASSAGSVIQVGFITGTAVPIISILLLAMLGYQQRSTPLTLARLGAPKWATNDDIGNVRPIVPDVTYTSLGDST